VHCDVIKSTVNDVCVSFLCIVIFVQAALQLCSRGSQHTKTDTRLTASSRTTGVSWHQKGKTILDFNEARDDGVKVASSGSYAKHFSLKQITTPVPHHSIFYRSDALPDTQAIVSKH